LPLTLRSAFAELTVTVGVGAGLHIVDCVPTGAIGRCKTASDHTDAAANTL
jgi:hypothetical protein